MNAIFERSSIHDQLVALLRQEIGSGRWHDELPREAELCRIFAVSRMTLRKALGHLAREQWIELGGRGRAHRILRMTSLVKQTNSHVIRMLTPFSRAQMGTSDHLVLESAGELLGAAGYRLEIVAKRRLFDSFQPAELKRLADMPDTAAWLLCYGTESLQRWFAEMGKPAVVMGRTYPGIELPSIYPDTEAAARHAVGQLSARGHKRLVYLIAEFTSLGDRMASQAFVEEAARLGARAEVVTYAPEPLALRRAIDSLLVMRPAPTGYYVSCPEHGLTVVCRLLRAGMRLPEDAALIAGWDDLCLDHTVPTVARYCFGGRKIGQKIAAAITEVLRNGTGKIGAVSILPELIPGGTLGTRTALTRSWESLQ